MYQHFASEFILSVLPPSLGSFNPLSPSYIHLQILQTELPAIILPKQD